MATRRTVGKSPLSGMVSKPSGKPGKEAEGEAEDRPVGESEGKARVNTTISPKLLERLRDAAYWTPGASVSSIVEEGVRREVERMEKENGGRFKPRKGRLQTGRRPQ